MVARMPFAMPNSQKPIQGAFGIPITMDFTATDNLAGDLALEMSAGTIDYVQAIYIDNSKNTKSLTITFSGMAYNITVKAGVQGVFPVLAAVGSLRWQAQSVGAAVVVPTIMFNSQQPYFTWQAA